MKSNMILIGLSGSGKTTLAKELAAVLDMRHIDIDGLLVRRMGMPISEIFSQYGEEYFRDLESEALAELAKATDTVVATGGGAVLREENITAMKNAGTLIYLDRPIERILKDISCSDRPLLKNGASRLYEMERQRRGLYTTAADVTYHNEGALDEALSALAAIIRARRISGGYAVIGNPIAHSLSPAIHKAVFANLGVKDDYRAACVQKGELPAFIRQVRNSSIKGFNATSPHKQDLLPLLDKIDPQAKRCGAVNTVVRRGGELVGFNTDMKGLSLAIRGHGQEYRGSRVVVLGTGGAAVGVVLRAALEGASSIHILGRRAEALSVIADMAKPYTIGTGDLSPQSLQDAAAGCDILVNTIPLEMSGVGGSMADMAPLLRSLPSTALVCDMVYSPPVTGFLRQAQELGLATMNGLPMLIYQAILADELYFGKRLDREALYRQIKNVLKQMEECEAV